MCSTSCFSRTVVQALNLALLVGGAFLILVGAIWANNELIRIVLEEFVILTICLGVFLTILALMALIGFTCCCPESCQITKKTFSWIYIVVLTILILGQIGLVVAFLVAQSDLKSFLNDRWTNDLDDHQRLQIQALAKCGDWEGKALVDDDSVEVFKKVDADENFEDCYKEIKKDFSSRGVLAIVIGLGVIAVQVVSLVASCCLVCEEKKVEPVMAAPYQMRVNMV